MLQQIDTIVQYLFRKNKLDEVAVEELRQFVDEYPYSSTGRFLLLKKLKEMRSDELEDEAAIASLYFHNPLWLEWALNGDDLKGSLMKTMLPAEEESEEETTEPGIQAAEPDAGTAEVQEEIVHMEPGETGKIQEPEEAESMAVEEVKNIATAPIAEQSTDTPEFEPYHTIDYFASQGIKLTAEDLEKDRFGKQLKSFTEWLRSMKRIAPSKMDTPIDSNGENNIQQMAGHSVEGTEAETEAMAEVWIKQGNRAKAIDIYRKLSLLNPSKSHYFAAKIDQLKD